MKTFASLKPQNLIDSGGFSSLGHKPRQHHQCCKEEGTAMRFRKSAKADRPGEGFLDQVQTITDYT